MTSDAVPKSQKKIIIIFHLEILNKFWENANVYLLYFSDIANLRKKFEEDKQKIALMKASRKFRPYWKQNLS